MPGTVLSSLKTYNNSFKPHNNPKWKGDPDWNQQGVPVSILDDSEERNLNLQDSDHLLWSFSLILNKFHTKFYMAFVCT